MPQLPALTPAEPPSLSALAISTPLWRLLSSNHDASTEISEIIADPALHREVREVCTALAQRSAAAGEHAVRTALQPLVLVFGVGEAARVPAFWEAYKVLAGLPAEALAAGVRDYLALPDSQFFPKPGPLKALCDKHAEPIFKAAYRASKAASLPPPKRSTVSQAEREAVHRMASEVAESLKMARTKAWPAKTPSGQQPYIGGKTDETGVTKEMRESIARWQR